MSVHDALTGMKPMDKKCPVCGKVYMTFDTQEKVL